MLFIIYLTSMWMPHFLKINIEQLEMLWLHYILWKRCSLDMDTLMYIYVCIHAHIQHTYTNRILFPFAKIIFSVFSFCILKKLFFENFFHKYNVFLSNPSPIPSSHNSSHTLPTTFPSQLLVCFFKHTESTMLPYLPECRFIRWNMSSLAEATS